MINSLRKLFFDKSFTVDRYKIIISTVAYLFLLYFVLVYAREIVNGGHSWKTGDWLINYEGGWIRRGLIGQILYCMSGIGVSILWCSFFIQTLIYCVIAHLVLKLFFSIKREISWLLFIFSPAFIFLFPFNDTGGGFRKETIVFLSYCLLVVGLMNGRLDHKYLISSLMIYIVAVFSHEIAAFCLIFFLYMLFESTGLNPILKRIGRMYVVGFLIAGVAGLAFSFYRPGGLGASSAICDSLVKLGLNRNICDGAIEWLSNDARYALSTVADHIPYFLPYYFTLLILAIIPLFLSDWWKKRLLLLLLGFGSLIPLFFVAIDWGRFIHIYIFMVFVSFLFDSCNERITIHKLKLPLIIVIIYASFWGLPHSGSEEPALCIALRILRRLVLLVQ